MPTLPSLIAVDLDGTLLRSDKSISPRTLLALDACKRAGILLAIASARGAASISLIVPDLLKDALWVTHNGALAVQKGTVLHSEPIQAQALHATVEFACNCHPPALLFAELDGRPCCSQDVEAMWGVGFHTTDFRTIGDHAVAKVLVQWPASIALSALKDKLPEGVEMILDRDGYVHVQRQGVSKHRALELCLTDLGISWSRVCAFGDDITDSGMLSAAGTGVAMGNALDSVKAQANHVTATNDEDGVAMFLEAMLAAA
ncbi:MAG: hypothetical protein RL318_2652 [Fibrobacterota bacterium]|jgi:Cof subfamily protein (haloacid dehalogenase superfamily)